MSNRIVYIKHRTKYLQEISQINKKFIKKKELKDNKYYNRKLNNKNNHKNVQICNITILNYIKNTFFLSLNAYTAYRILQSILIVFVKSKIQN